MIQFLVLYRTPPDPAEFDAHYFGSHLPLVSDVPGLVRAEVSRISRQLAGEPSYYLTASLYFADMDAFKMASKSEAWAAMGADLQSWGGMALATMLVTEVIEP